MLEEELEDIDLHVAVVVGTKRMWYAVKVRVEEKRT